MTLKSEFKFNDQLVRCETEDSAHVGTLFNPRGEHVKLIRKALNAWLKGQGVAFRLDETSAVYDTQTAGIVRDYKTAKNILNWKGQIDDVVGKKTVVALDGELPVSLDPIDVLPGKYLDVVVAFRGAHPEDPETELPPERIMELGGLDKYKKNALDTSLRQLLRIGHITKTTGAAAKKNRDKMHKKIDDALGEREIGKIFVWGTSAGGRNAIDFANELPAHGRRAAYVSLCDAAFFPNETNTKPDDADPPTTTPVFDFNITADRKESYFQLAGNKTEFSISQRRRIFSSDMDGKEIHGNVQGCTPHPLKVSTPFGGLVGANKLHEDACKLGADRTFSDIAGILNNLGAEPE